ncbi:hypothetical protein K469DRAFT_733677 [Zopfia rhizophila CBS 207.26]|uniref:Zn(2)-C6 fungal-type domain-containing protein n=1 Tax=Zopfia rhizophila CBS 207.26 TaxID=1314779 RepID=A0A6A6DAK2_9PEZI|nr:hypothetical protein K469DRAFT_733677 [Zopfia rhizophila CBS 207.26]
MSQHSPPEQQTPSSEPAPRPARSKNGCNACRRRKVRCNERRPRCAHCERLNLDCTWNRAPITRNAQSASSQVQPCSGQQMQAHTSMTGFDGFGLNGGGFFDFSGPLATWDEAMLLSPNSWPSDPSMTGASVPLLPTEPFHPAPSLTENAQVVRHAANVVPERSRDGATSTSPFSSEGTANPSSLNDDFLINTFLQMLMPPILTPVEIGPKWASTRAFFATMSAESPIVRLAIMAFAALQIQRSSMEGVQRVDWRPLYDNASRQLSAVLGRGAKEGRIEGKGEGLKHVLAAMFLLTYTDLLTEMLPRAHANLREAYNLIQNADKDSFTVPEKRLISWLRLLDARAVSTDGGEGLFLTDNDESLFDASPAPAQANEAETLDTEIEEILFDVLYHPGIVFYQKVQSFVGRITKIDPWHRSRGTVQDETEVMALAAQISKDLHALYGQRPALMDHAVAGNLTEKHLAKNLAGALTRSFRTYLANYHASFLHLHRVAYKQYPKTKDVAIAIANIKKLSHLMAETDESLPVNLLWPLLMWGCEEENPEERRWILDAIRGLESIATNAKATADLLEEVQRRQDEGRCRVDVRTVSQEYFSSNHFAIV